MKLTKEYLLHNTGIHNLINYCLFYEARGFKHNWTNDIIFLDKNMSQFFGFTQLLSNGKKSNNPQLLVQNEEKKWLSLIQWEKLIVLKNEGLLVLIAKEMFGDNNVYSDLPSFGIAIHMGVKDYFDLFDENYKFEARECWKDDDNNINVVFTNKLFSMDVEKVNSGIPQIKREVRIHNAADFSHWSDYL